MNPTDYSQLPLRDIHLPGAIPWWPPAPGWWILAGLFILALVYLWLRYRSQYRERAALKALKRVRTALEGGDEPGECIAHISMILRRFAMSLGEPVPVAGLTGQHWLRFLDSRWDKQEFSEGAGRILIFGPYAPPDRVGASDALSLNGLCIDWVKAQHPER